MKKMFFLTFFLIASISVSALNQRQNLPFIGLYTDNNNVSVVNSSVYYSFLFTDNNDCSSPYLNYTENLTSDRRGVVYTEINISNLTFVPKYLCEYVNGSLRKTHNMFNTTFQSTMNSSQISAIGFNTTSQLTSLYSALFSQLSGIDASNITSGNIESNRLSGTYSISVTGSSTNVSCSDCVSSTQINESSLSGTASGLTCGVSNDLSCSDCLDSTEISDVYVLNTGDSIDGNLNINGNLTVIGSVINATVINEYLNGSFLPSLNNIFDIGSTALGWKKIYSNDWGNVTILVNQIIDKNNLVNTHTLSLSNITDTGNLDMDSTNDLLTTTTFSGAVTGQYNTLIFNSSNLNSSIDLRTSNITGSSDGNNYTSACSVYTSGATETISCAREGMNNYTYTITDDTGAATGDGYWPLPISTWLYNNSNTIDLNTSKLTNSATIACNNITGNASNLCTITQTTDTNSWWPLNVSTWLVNSSNSIDLNDTKLNNTIDSRNNFTSSTIFNGNILTLGRNGMSSITATVPNNAITINCANITGGSDGDYCADNTGVGGSGGNITGSFNSSTGYIPIIYNQTHLVNSSSYFASDGKLYVPSNINMMNLDGGDNAVLFNISTAAGFYYVGATDRMRVSGGAKLFEFNDIANRIYFTGDGNPVMDIYSDNNDRNYTIENSGSKKANLKVDDDVIATRYCIGSDCRSSFYPNLFNMSGIATNDSSGAATWNTNIANLTLYLAASTAYSVECVLLTQSAATATGIQTRVNTTNTPLSLYYTMTYYTSATAEAICQGTNVASNTCSAATSGGAIIQPMRYNAYIKVGGSASVLTWELATEVDTSLVSVWPGSYCQAIKLT